MVVMAVVMKLMTNWEGQGYDEEGRISSNAGLGAAEEGGGGAEDEREIS